MTAAGRLLGIHGESVARLCWKARVRFVASYTANPQQLLRLYAKSIASLGFLSLRTAPTDLENLKRGPHLSGGYHAKNISSALVAKIL